MGTHMTTGDEFGSLARLIESARSRALQKVNEELVLLYFDVGRYLSEEAAKSSFGDKFIDSAATFMSQRFPEMRGFNRRGLYRMKQFYETYAESDEVVTALLTQLSWTNHLIVMAKSKTADERRFYLELCAKEHYTSRQLERQMDSAYYERSALSQGHAEQSATPAQAGNTFFDSYVLDFLDLPKTYSESDFEKAIVGNLKDFILEIGRDFSFVGEQYRIQVGGHDYYLDLLFYHRELMCLVAFELKVDEFKPEYLGKMNFYLEALDRDVRHANENPSVGVILCAQKNDEVVEYALSRSLSPTLISEYALHLPDKKLLQQKLREFAEAADIGKADGEE